jgi:sugar phosphate isomerase/epimerase
MPRVTACSTLTFALSSLQTALEHIARYGFDRVEIADMLTHTKHFSAHSSRTVDPVAVRELLKRNGLAAIAANCALVTIYQEGLGYEKVAAPRQSAAEREDVREAKENIVFYKLHEPRQAEAYKAQARVHLDNLSVVGVPMVCLNVGRRAQMQDPDGELQAAAAVIDEVAEHARRRGIRVVLEMPHVWQLYYDVDRSRQMLSLVKSDNVGVVLDATHWHTSGYDVDEYVSFLGDRLWNVHLRDAAGKDSPGGDFLLEATPGKGEVDFGLLGRTLDKHDYRGNVTLETEYKNYREESEVDAENASALAHLESVGWEVPKSD